MSYTPSSLIHNSREVRAQYLRKGVRLLLQKLKSGLFNRQALPVFVAVKKA